MTAPKSQVGATVSIVSGTPATEDQSGYEALSYTEIGSVIEVPEMGTTVEAGTTTHLKDGVTRHFNGPKIAQPFAIPYTYALTDAGQVICRAGAGGNTVHSIVVTDEDGETRYIQGYLGSLIDNPRTPTSEKGQSITINPVSLWTVVTS